MDENSNSNSSFKKGDMSDGDEKSTSGSFKFKKRFGKNPNVDTSFLPDKEREAEEDALR
jgi:protein FAM50